MTAVVSIVAACFLGVNNKRIAVIFDRLEVLPRGQAQQAAHEAATQVQKTANSAATQENAHAERLSEAVSSLGDHQTAILAKIEAGQHSHREEVRRLLEAHTTTAVDTLRSENRDSHQAAEALLLRSRDVWNNSARQAVAVRARTTLRLGHMCDSGLGRSTAAVL
jgi:uncharacterized protein YyaL (SSP411 family)